MGLHKAAMWAGFEKGEDELGFLLGNHEENNSCSNWILQHWNDHKQLVVGLDVEWRPSFSRRVEYKVAILQLCVEHTCLEFQLLYVDHIPNSLIDFLKNPNLRFVGVGIEGDVERLLEDHELNVLNNLDLRSLAAKRLSMPELRSSGLKELTREVLGKEIRKPKKVTMSRWDVEWLTYDQVQYACLDAFLSFEIGKSLLQKRRRTGE
ncbi:Werner Syndrome-like exonuclease [Telopea speciosissima]|uniref:Werner Syndrome-like exonuclease n=1 Tax=Telopea speciosissima TaxID=54955 RepID=UPI001CC7244C|nr:Werner Syndrome-like exonuclease [Telopea speciosissima]